MIWERSTFGDMIRKFQSKLMKTNRGNKKATATGRPDEGRVPAREGKKTSKQKEK